VKLLQSELFWDSFWVTVKFVCMSAPIGLLLGLCLALLLNRKFKGKHLIQTFMLIPMMVAPIAAYLSWSFLLDPTYGVVNYLLGLIGVEGIGWFSSVKTALISVVLVDLWLTVPFVFLVLFAALQAVPQDPVESAQVDGANRLQTFWHVILPSIMPVLMVVTIIRIMDAIRVFDNIFVLTQGGPGGVTKTIQYMNYELAFQAFEVGRGSALAIIIVLVILLVGSVLIRQMNKTNKELRQ
jgi:multiple sugar transport system permease protein